MWLFAPECPVTWISLWACYPHPTGNGLFTPTNAFYSWILSSAKLVCQCRQTLRSDSSSADRTRIFISACTDPVPLDTIQSQSRLISPTPTLHSTFWTPEDMNESYFFFFLFILARRSTFRLWCGSYINQVFPSILLFSKSLLTFCVTYFPTCFYHFDLGLPKGCFPFSFLLVQNFLCDCGLCVSVSNLYGMGSLQSLVPTAGYLTVSQRRVLPCSVFLAVSGFGYDEARMTSVQPMDTIFLNS